MRRRFWYGFLPGKVFKGGSTPTTWQKARYIFCPQFVGRCQMFSRRSEFIVWRLKPKICIQNPRNLNSTSGFRNSVTSLVWFLHPFWNCGIPPPLFKNRFCSVEVLCEEGFFEGFSGPENCLSCLPWEDCYSWWTKVSPLLSKALLYAARLDTMQGPAAVQDFVWSTMLQWQRATPYESIQTAENRISRIPFYFSISDFCRTCDQLFFLSHDQFLDPQLTGIPWSSNASWFLIGTCITGKVPRRFFGKIRRCSLLACVLAQHWHFLSMLFFHLGALNTRCLDR